MVSGVPEERLLSVHILFKPRVDDIDLTATYEVDSIAGASLPHRH